MTQPPPAPRTLAELRRAGYVSRGVRDEMRANLLVTLKEGRHIFEDMLGYDDTVIPAVIKELDASGVTTSFVKIANPQMIKLLKGEISTAIANFWDSGQLHELFSAAEGAGEPGIHDTQARLMAAVATNVILHRAPLSLDEYQKSSELSIKAIARRELTQLKGKLNQTQAIGGDPLKALEQFNRFQILGAVNIGPYGVNALNRLAEQILKQEALINPDQEWYRGRPVMITRNDYKLGLFNGDMGITLPVPGSDSQKLYVCFPGDSGDFRSFLPSRLPEHETAFATTVHKSQGSEFNDILLVLPNKDYPVLTRELLYTAITRARNNISIWGTQNILKRKRS